MDLLENGRTSFVILLAIICFVAYLQFAFIKSEESILSVYVNKTGLLYTWLHEPFMWNPSVLAFITTASVFLILYFVNSKYAIILALNPVFLIFSAMDSPGLYLSLVLAVTVIPFINKRLFIRIFLMVLFALLIPSALGGEYYALVAVSPMIAFLMTEALYNKMDFEYKDILVLLMIICVSIFSLYMVQTNTLSPDYLDVIDYANDKMPVDATLRTYPESAAMFYAGRKFDENSTYSVMQRPFITNDVSAFVWSYADAENVYIYFNQTFITIPKV
jgi:hypothetical protein